MENKVTNPPHEDTKTDKLKLNKKRRQRDVFQKNENNRRQGKNNCIWNFWSVFNSILMYFNAFLSAHFRRFVRISGGRF